MTGFDFERGKVPALPERAQRMWDKGKAPSAIDRAMCWTPGRCRKLMVMRWAAIRDGMGDKPWGR